MIIKRTPEDFCVEEVTEVQPGDGPFALYLLEKKGWTTPDALAAVRRRWRIDLGRLSYGGLKDRHAHTLQYFTIFRGPQRKLTQGDVRVTYLGQTHEPFSSRNIRANRFRLILRRLSPAQVEHAVAELPAVRDYGVPNYFDDQRFGSVAGGGPFLARAIMLGHFEEALRLALTAHYPHDRRPQKVEKQTLRSYWGDWAACKERLSRGHARSLVEYLVHHPNDFRGALERLRPELRGLYLSAYQSHLWNRVLAAWLESFLPAVQRFDVQLLLGPAPMFRRLETEELSVLQEKTIALASAKTHFAADDPVRPFFERVLEQEGVTLTDFRLKGIREMFFSRGERRAHCRPEHLTWSSDSDDLHPGAYKIALSFELPAGSYATLIVKRITKA
ncbi:MAG: tRNA pseudouridine(13) synthase TruD [Gemmataceae bacterium]